MKIPGDAAARVATSLRDAGPATVTDLAERLGVTATAVRRSLGALVDAGLVAMGDRAPYGPAPKPRRGRPSQVYWLTASGHIATSEAPDLALEVLDHLARSGGEPAVRAFAAERAERLMERLQVTPAGALAGIAETLTAAGYAADVVATPGAATVQLCQHACPIVEAASAFPELCEAEAEALGGALGVHVTRLATLAAGDGVCTTVIPIQSSSHPHAIQGVHA